MIALLISALLLGSSQDRVQELITQMLGKDAKIRIKAMEDLVKIGKPAVEALEKLAASDDPAVRAAATETIQRISWPALASLDRIQQNENGEPRVQMAEADGDAYEKLKKAYPDHRIYRLTFSTLEGTFSRMDTYVVKRYEAEVWNMSTMSKERKSGWVSATVQAKGVKLASEAEAQEFVESMRLFVGPMLFQAACIRGTGHCGGATVVRKAERGWEYYHETCGDYATLHEIWEIQTGPDGKIEKITINPEGKKFELDKK